MFLSVFDIIMLSGSGNFKVFSTFSLLFSRVIMSASGLSSSFTRWLMKVLYKRIFERVCNCIEKMSGCQIEATDNRPSQPCTIELHHILGFWHVLSAAGPRGIWLSTHSLEAGH